MQIAGKWLVGDDGVTRPVLVGEVQAADGRWISEPFLIDSGADRTVFGAKLLMTLGSPSIAAPTGLVLEGIGGECGSTTVRTVLRLTCDDRRLIHLKGEFAAFTEASATDLSILGRDVLDIFDVIQSRRRNEVFLLGENHSYRVVTT
jgi:hypothetical protein